MADQENQEINRDDEDRDSEPGRLLHGGHTGFDNGADVLRAHLKTMPEQPGVYRMVSVKGSVLYVGKAKNLKKRVSSYTQRTRLPYRLQRMVAQTVNLEIVVTHTETEALLLEANLIQHYMPPFNVLLRDDKSYPYVLITRDHDFPQIFKHRGSRTRKGWYFGPFASAGKVRETITLLQRGFMLRNCTDSFFANRTRPCLQFHIKRCTAPCVQKVSKDDYAHQVDDAIEFLKGRSQTIQQNMATQMQAASDATDYELAATLRDRIAVLTSMQARQDINVAGIDDADIIALHQIAGKTAIQVFFFRSGRNYGARTYYPSHDKHVEIGEILEAFLAQFYAAKTPPPQIFLSDLPEQKELLEQAFTEKAQYNVELILPKLGDKKRLIEHARKNAQEALARTLSENSEQKKLLARVTEIFGMPEPPQRIEVYDNSHISGSHAIGAMIAAGPEGFLKKTYRKFNIRNTEVKGDDYAMMEEVLRRRFKRLVEEDPERASGVWPDLILIDGGEGQLGKVTAVATEMGLIDLTIVGIAKGPDRNAGKERFFMPGREPFSLPHNDPALYYLQRLRDEAHRFAIGTHRAKHAKAIGVSGLEDVPGIGGARKRALLHHFGSAKAVAAAGLDDLTRVTGISQSVAKKIHDYFRDQG
jgi:excinuclease ABC subunit C